MNKKQKILVTGGTGYIGSHTIVELISEGHDVVCIDNLSNSSPAVLDRLKAIIGKDIAFYKGDVQDESLLEKIFDTEQIDIVIHFAALKSVSESVTLPLDYYSNNIGGLIALCKVMQAKGVRKLIFSSSATVYGKPKELPLMETSPVGHDITNPYGQTKYMAERILSDLAHSSDDWGIVALRYFNPIGAHETGMIGEDPKNIPANIMPFIAQVAIGKLPELKIFGGDYDTPDGTAMRDYIHVTDLARGHVSAITYIQNKKGLEIFNLGTGRGVSVLEILHAFESVTGQRIPYQVTGKRPGDVDICYANTDKAESILGWKAEKTLEDACRDTWRWQSQNPKGFAL